MMETIDLKSDSHMVYSEKQSNFVQKKADSEKGTDMFYGGCEPHDSNSSIICWKRGGFTLRLFTATSE